MPNVKLLDQYVAYCPKCLGKVNLKEKRQREVGRLYTTTKKKNNLWGAEVGINDGRDGSLTRKVKFRIKTEKGYGNFVTVQATFYDKLLEILS